jgi:ABC-type glycerol-3-phosphate transport system permease component
MAPVVWLFLSSLKSETQFNTIPIVFLPLPPVISNYIRAVTEFPFAHYAGNSLFLAASSTVLTVLSSALGGFGFARRRARLARLFFVLVLAMMMVPRMVTIIPTFIFFTRLGLTNTYWPWILWGATGAPFHIFLFRQFFTTIPRDLEDAAVVDGCGGFRTFWQIFLPNSGPALATSAIFHFRWVWGDWFTPNIFLSDELTTLGVKLAKAYVDPQGNAIVTLTLAAIFIYVLPIIIVFFVAQRNIIQGVVTTGMKG